jgi:hypothetical protein
MARTGQLEQDSWNRTANVTARVGLAEKDYQDRAASTGLPEMAANTGPLG